MCKSKNLLLLYTGYGNYNCFKFEIVHGAVIFISYMAYIQPCFMAFAISSLVFLSLFFASILLR